MVSFPYYSHNFRDSYGSGMGIIWVPLPIFGGPMSLGVPENPIESIPWKWLIFYGYVSITRGILMIKSWDDDNCEVGADHQVISVDLCTTHL